MSDRFFAEAAKYTTRHNTKHQCPCFCRCRNPRSQEENRCRPTPQTSQSAGST